MKERDDIDPATTYVTSDSHFGHDNIVDFSHRPSGHESIMLEEWARAVPEDATVLHLGDLVYKNNSFFQHIHSKHLTGKRKLLVQGNHDRKSYNFYKKCGFKFVRPFYIPYRKHVVSFSHYPWSDHDTGRPMKVNDLRLHGHIHNSGYVRNSYVPFLRQHINLSVEQTKYRPVNLKLLLDGYLFGELPEALDI